MSQNFLKEAEAMRSKFEDKKNEVGHFNHTLRYGHPPLGQQHCIDFLDNHDIFPCFTNTRGFPVLVMVTE